MGGMMKFRLIWIFGAVLFLLTAASALCQTQSLADYAKREKERRDQITAAQKAIKNEDTGRYKAAAISTGGISSTPEPAPSKPGEGGEAASKLDPNAKPDEPSDFQGRPESFWRQTFSDARQRVRELEDKTNVIYLKLNDLQNQFYRESDGFRQQEMQREIQKTFYEQDKTKEELAKAKDALSDLEKEARKSGALPGWITPKP
jgi:hypothetical protein